MPKNNNTQENKLKNFIERGKSFFEKTKGNLSSIYNMTKEKLMDTINIISKKISKLKRQTEEDIAELFSNTQNEVKNDIKIKNKEEKKDIEKNIEEEEEEKKAEEKDTSDVPSDTEVEELVNVVPKNIYSEGTDNGQNNDAEVEYDKKEDNNDEENNDEEEYSYNFFENDIDDFIKQEIIRQIMEKEGKREYYAQGSEGIIFKIEINNKGEKKEFLVAKKRYDHKTQNEYKLQEDVQNLLPIGDNTVRVPELKAEITGLNGENYIIMEFINGKTIYQLTIEKILRKIGFGTFNFENDKEATNCFGKFLGIERNTEKNLNQLDKQYESLSKDIKIFDSETGKKYEKAMRDFIQGIHNAGIYHRDIHPKNIIIGDDGKLYIIDFGKSIKVDPDKDISKKEIYTEQVGEMTGEYVRDESGILMIRGLTKSEEDEDNEQRIKNHIEKEKNLTKKINSGESIISYFTTLPKGFKIKMEWNDFLKNVDREGKKSKRYSLDTLLDSKGDELIIYLFAQSKENIDHLLGEIEKVNIACQETIKKYEKDPRADQPLFRKKYITPPEKKIKGMSTLKKKLEKLKTLTE